MPNAAPRPASERGRDRGLAYELWLPEARPPWPGVVVLHGAGSRKENHADFGRLASGMGWAALAYDQRGHGDSEGEMSPAALTDAARMARLLAGVEGVDPERVCVRGSSMGGLVAIHAAATASAVRGAIAICPAAESGLVRELRRGGLEMRADADALIPWLQEHDLRDAVALMGAKPLILLHARGDDVIPAQWSEKLYERAGEPRKLVVVPGGHHRSVQHDPELQGTALRWIERAL
jgi:alpha-beta hydrolase superfamily lysophospholipase